LSGTSETVTAVNGRWVLPETAKDTPATISVAIPGSGYVTIDDTADPMGSTPMGFGRNGDDREWYVRLNVSQLAASYPGVFSGPVTLRYLVYDNAGNISVYDQTLVFRENAPLITSVTLGTDLRNNTALQANTGLTLDNIRAAFPAEWADTRKGISGPITINHNSVNQHNAGNAFTVRNNLLVLEVRTATALAGRNFRVYYVTGNSPVNASALANGSIYTITTDGGTNWDAVGAPPGWKAALASAVPFMASGNTPYGSGTANLLGTTAPLTKALTSGAATANLVFNPAAFGTGSIVDSDKAQFVIKVWDGDETNGVADFVVLNIRVKNTDTTAPGTVTLHPLNPNTEGASEAMTLAQAAAPAGIGQNRTRGGIYNVDPNNASLKRSGHIEPRKTNSGFTYTELGITAAQWNLLPANDAVSGTVILRGYVEDDTRIGSVTVNIGGTEKKILEAADPLTGNITDPSSLNTGLLRVPAGDSDVTGKVFFADTVDLSGHRVEWAYVWDTQRLPSATATVGAATLQVKAVNNKPVPADTDKKETVSLNVDRKPYVTGINRGNSSWVSGRSVQGWYGFAREETVTVTGFNFKGTGDLTLTVPVSSGSGAVNAAQTTVTNITDPTEPAGNAAAFAIPAAAKSGALLFSNSGTISVNAVDGHTIFPWNQEASVVEGSGLWDDHIHAHVWQSGNTAGSSSVDGDYFDGTTANPMEYPSMSIDPANGQLWGAYAYDGNDGYAMGTNNFGSAKAELFNWHDPVVETDIYYNGGRYTVYNIQGRYQNQTGWNNLGGIYIKAPSGGASTGISGSGNNGNHYLVEKGHYNNLSDQFVNPHIVTYKDGSSMRMHVSYYDSKDGSIKYRHFLEGEAVENGSGATKGWINLDGGYDEHDSVVETYSQTINGTTGVAKGPDDRYLGKFHKNVGDVVNVGDVIAVYGTANNHTINNSNNTGSNPSTANRYFSRHLVTLGQYVTTGTPLAEYGNSAHTNVYQLLARADGYVNFQSTTNQPAGIATVVTLATNPYNLTALTGGTLASMNTADHPSGTDVVFTIANDGRVVSPRTPNDTGFYNAIDVTRDGYPVVVYQDRTAGTLKLAYVVNGTSKAPDRAANWVTQPVFPAGDPNGTNVGDYVSFRIDKTNDHIHIAAIRGAELIYITGTRNASTGAYSFSPSKVVDSPGSVGKWVDLSLDNGGNPYIVYRLSRGARLVFLDGSKFNDPLSDRNGQSIAGWEAMNVSTRFRVDDHRLGIENYPVRGGPANPTAKFWHAAVGYIGEDTTNNAFRIAYYVKY
jgi:hypothetical protein